MRISSYIVFIVFYVLFLSFHSFCEIRTKIILSAAAAYHNLLFMLSHMDGDGDSSGLQVAAGYHIPLATCSSTVGFTYDIN